MFIRGTTTNRVAPGGLAGSGRLARRMRLLAIEELQHRRAVGRTAHPVPAPRGRADGPAAPPDSPMVAAGPLVIMTMRSDSSTASSTSWVTITTVDSVGHDLQQLVLQMRASAHRVRRRARPSAAPGLHRQRRAMPTRCFMPPEISWGAWFRPRSGPPAPALRACGHAVGPVSLAPNTRSTPR
jgi:hypothetical protein